MLAAVLPLLVLGAGVGWMLVDQRRDAVEDELAGTARALRVAVDRELASHLNAMQVLATAHAPDGAVDLDAFSAALHAMLAQRPDWSNLVLVEPTTHRIVASGLPLPTPHTTTMLPAEVDDVVRTGKPKIVGVMETGAVQKTPFIVMLAPVSLAGTTRYVLGLAVSPEALSTSFAEQGLNASWTGAIVDPRLRIAGRSRDSGKFVGKPVTPTLARRIQQGEQSLFSALNQEGATVYTVFSRSPTTGWTVAIGVPGEYVQAPVRALWVKLAVAGSVLLALSLMLTGRVARTIVERRDRYEQALHESRERLDASLSGADLATWEVHFPSGGFRASPRWSEMLGGDAAVLTPTIAAWQALVCPDDLPRVIELLDEKVHAGTAATFEAEYRMRHVDGQWVWLLVRGKVVERDGTGRPVRAMGTAHDMTERKQAALAAERDRVRLETVLRTASDGIYILDRDGRLLEANPAFLQAIGHDRSAIGQLTVADWDPDATPEAMDSQRRDVLEDGNNRTIVTRRRHHDGTLRDVEISVDRMVIDGETYFCAASRDITERKQLDAELARHRHHLEDLVASRTAELAAARDAAESANRAKSAFLANMSHELRTPMHGILGLAGLARQRAADAQQRDQLDKTMSAARHLMAIINDILDLSKIEAGQLALRPADFSLARVLDEALEMVAGRARTKGLELVRTVAPDVPDALHGDGVRLTQIVVNFLGNAVKFSERGRIELRASGRPEGSDGIRLRIEIEDEGCGIAADVLPRLFQPFVQADDSSTRAHGGTGLGLTISRHIARLMGGDVGVTSEPGRGSTFWASVSLELGRAETPAPQAEDALETLRREHAGTRVLLADDNPVNLEVATMLLENAGLTVDVCEDGRACVERARAGRHAIVLMDLQMPEMNGLDATRAIRALPDRAGVPIVAMTASVFEHERAACEAAGMDDHIIKPVDPEILYAKLLKWLSPRSVATPGTAR